MKVKRIATSIVVGVLITLFSGLFTNPLSGILLGVSLWGIPLPWMTQVIYPNAPRTIQWGEFALDTVFWMMAFYLCYYRVYKMRRTAKSSSDLEDSPRPHGKCVQNARTYWTGPAQG